MSVGGTGLVPHTGRLHWRLRQQRQRRVSEEDAQAGDAQGVHARLGRAGQASGQGQVQQASDGKQVS